MKKNSEDWKTYKEERTFLNNAILDQSKSFDKYVLTLSGGAFGISLIFIKDIVKTPQPIALSLLIAAWVLFGVSITFTLVSFLLSQEACKMQIEINRAILLENDKTKIPINVYGVITSVLNWLSGSVFIAGISSLAAFAIQNIM
jgi:hypothetical protein